jgi:hypothetical protein
LFQYWKAFTEDSSKERWDSYNKDEVIQFQQDKYVYIIEFCKLKLKSYKRSIEDYPLKEILPSKMNYYTAEEL